MCVCSNTCVVSTPTLCVCEQGMPVEEVYAHTLNMCVGMVGVVSLLLATSLRPESGNPVSGVTLHTHRNRDILYLGTKSVMSHVYSQSVK